MFNIKVEKFAAPYKWINMTDLFNEKDKQDLATTYPCDNYRTISLNAANRQYNYDVRALVNFQTAQVENRVLLSKSWAAFAGYLASKEYKKLISELTGIDVTELSVEANVYKYAK